jgi:spoIIIJ-associated protein
MVSVEPNRQGPNPSGDGAEGTMEWIEITAKTVAEAIDAALDELGVDEDDMEYEVLEEPRKGMFGLFTGPPARIRARVKPISREKPDRRRRRPESRSGGEGGGGGRQRRPAAPAASAAPTPADDDELTGAAGTGPGRSGARRHRSRRRKPGTGASSVTSSSGMSTGERSVSGTDVSLQEQAELAEEFTRGLIERFGFKAAVHAEPDGDEDVQVDVEGDDLGLLIGPRAVTLDALQELVRTAVQRRIGGHSARIHVDVAGYRAQRSEALAEFARQAAQRALESGRDQVFEPMSPGDRKIVHDTVNAVEGVSTISEGEEPRRRVVIKPSS